VAGTSLVDRDTRPSFLRNNPKEGLGLGTRLHRRHDVKPHREHRRHLQDRASAGQSQLSDMEVLDKDGVAGEGFVGGSQWRGGEAGNGEGSTDLKRGMRIASIPSTRCS